MPPPDATLSLYQLLQRLQLVLVLAGRRAWTRMDPDDFDGSWRAIAPALVGVTAAAQLAAARAGVEYVPTVLAEQRVSDSPLVRVQPEAFAGRASDGRDLLGLLTGAVVRTKLAVPGMDGGDALALGQKWLEQTLQTAVSDAARDATTASIVARPDVGWVRMINPPCCSRCAVLAGRVYKWNDGFQRHPGCDCLHIPTTLARADSFLADPRALVDRGQVTDLTAAQKARLDEGADLSRVLNESRDRWREGMAADRRSAGPVDRAGRSRGANWTGWAGGGTNPPPPGTTIHQLMDKLTADVSRIQAARAMREAGIAA